MTSVTVMIPHAQVLADRVAGNYVIRSDWQPTADASDRPLLGTQLSADGSTNLYLTYWQITRTGSPGHVHVSLVDNNTASDVRNFSGPEFSDAIENGGTITFEASDGRSVTVTGISDATEPYSWLPSNAADLRDFADHVAGLSDRSLVITFDDGVNPEFYNPANAANQGNFPSGLNQPQGMAWDGQRLVIAEGSAGPDHLFALGRNTDGSYAPANAAIQTSSVIAASWVTGMTWDGQQLVIIDSVSDELWTLARNADGSYSPANATKQGDLPANLASAPGVTWDGQQLVIVDNAGDEIWTLARDMDGGYTPANAVNQGGLPAGLDLPGGITWDGQRLVITDTDGDEIWVLGRNADGSYTPANAANQGGLPATLTAPNSMTWDGQQLVIANFNPSALWTLAPNQLPSYFGNTLYRRINYADAPDSAQELIALYKGSDLIWPRT